MGKVALTVVNIFLVVFHYQDIYNLKVHVLPFIYIALCPWSSSGPT